MIQSTSPDLRTFSAGDWVVVRSQGAFGKIIEKTSLWGNTIFRVWLPSIDSTIRVDASALSSVQSSALTTHHLTYLAVAARVADALTQDILLAPLESSVIPLPHQIRALSRAISGDRVRYLLADEVGLGKTIEAGLIMKELKFRGLIKRTLVVAPKGLVTQWVAEMKTHFNEEFQLIIPGDFSIYKRILPEKNIWQAYDQIVCPIDSVKPSDGRRGWSKEQIAEYNRERFEDLISAGWDLIIVDEAHRLGGSSDQVARYKLGRALSEAAPYLLLLTATPHQGKTESFYRLISLLDSSAFPDPESINREIVKSYVIRTEKLQAIDAKGAPLFKPRQTRLEPVSWTERHREQRLLYNAVTEYVREGYNQALKEKKTYIGFLMILFQRLVTSSTRAICTTLERRLEALHAPDEQLSLFPMLSEEDWADLDGQQLVDKFINARLKALRNESEEVKLLLEASKRTELSGPDAKAEALLDWIYKLQQEEGNPDLKIIVFTEFVPTQDMLYEFLTERGFPVVCINGSMTMEERQKAQEAFSRDARILISTDAGGEGLNLQFCHVVLNYDIPWNPMRLEQRIGRVDRIGQTHTVRAINFVLQGTVEHRVREVLEEKLAVIFEEFGVDKTGDVLDSAQAEIIFDELYIESILQPERVDDIVDSKITRVKEQVKTTREGAAILGSEDEPDPGEAERLIEHPLPYWVENMTVSYLRSHGGKAEKQGNVWNLTWPDGATMQDVVFLNGEAEGVTSARKLTLEDSRIRSLIMGLPRFAPGQPIPCIKLTGLPEDVRGVWSLWKITIQAIDCNRQRIMPIFRHDNGRVLLPTARHIWERILSGIERIHGYLSGKEAEEIFNRMLNAAELHGRPIYEDLLRMHQEWLARERGKGEYAFQARQRNIERIGLPQVRQYRLAQLIEQEKAWKEKMRKMAEINPEMVPILLIRIEGE